MRRFMLWGGWILLTLIVAPLVCAERNFYSILEVSRSATTDQIKKAYRKLTLKYHPDRNKDPSAAEKFQDIAAAYEVLGDAEKRQIYDDYGEQGLKNHLERGNQPDIFDIMTGFGHFGFHGPRQRRNEKVDAIVIPLYVDLSQLYFGDLFYVTFNRPVICLKAEECIIKMSDCSGPGVRTVNQRLGPGFLVQNQIEDDSCIDYQKAFKKNCSACPKGRTETQKASHTVYIDEGMENGDLITLEGAGIQKIGYDSGDVVFVIHQVKNPTYDRVESNLYSTVYLTLLQALVGFDKSFHHVSNKKLHLHRKTVTHDGQTEVLKGWGMPIRSQHGQYGDLIITYRIQYPAELSSRSQELIQEALGQTTTWVYEVPAPTL